jgi:hypothetical protein
MQKARQSAGACYAALRRGAHLSAVCTLVKVVFSFEPRPCMTAMIATEMPAAIRPYSMAVAPDWSFAKDRDEFGHGLLLEKSTRGCLNECPDAMRRLIWNNERLGGRDCNEVNVKDER